jgi:hypothetical protein
MLMFIQAGGSGPVCHLCLLQADQAGIQLYGRWYDFGRIVPKTDR